MGRLRIFQGRARTVDAVLAEERPDLHVYRVDPGDLRTQMHQEAFPGEDISDRPLPEVAVPGLVHLLEGDEPSGRYPSAGTRDGGPVVTALAESPTVGRLQFELPSELEASIPPEGAWHHA